MNLQTCVTPEGIFYYGVHKPHYNVANLRQNNLIQSLGKFADGTSCNNSANFPEGDITENQADWVYEIPNPFPFRGTTYITKSWADTAASDKRRFGLKAASDVSFVTSLKKWQPDLSEDALRSLFHHLPRPVLLAVAANATDPADLVRLAHHSCQLILDENGTPQGFSFQGDSTQAQPIIHDQKLFKILVNNPYLPDAYKEVMVLRPGVQGSSEIVGEWQTSQSHVFEYLRRNSYIPWGHYAANMANDAIRYEISNLTAADMQGMRHLYYQRTYVRIAEELDIPLKKKKGGLSPPELETFREQICAALLNRDFDKNPLAFDAILWGWNFGFDCASSEYKLHASHQMIHQQFALIPATVESCETFPADEQSLVFQGYCCGDLVDDFITRYKEVSGSDFFTDYLCCIENNQRFDGNELFDKSLVVYQDSQVILFVPKAQTSQWELQLMPKKPFGNIVEADMATRNSLDAAILTALKVLTNLGARMVSSIEFSKRLSRGPNGQHLLISFLPKLPDSPGAFSEAQLRWINGHYPEDFAGACRNALSA